MIRQTKQKDKAKKWLVVGSVILGVALFLFIGQYVFTNWLQQKLEKTVNNNTDGVYQLELFGMETSPFVGTLSVDSLALTPDYDRWKELKSQGKDVSRTLVELRSKAISLNRLSFFKILFQNNVDLDSMLVQNPELLITAMAKDTTGQHQPMHKTVNGLLRNMHIGKIDVNDANLRYRNYNQRNTDMFALKSFNLTVDDFRLDSTSLQDPKRAYYSNNIVLKAKAALYNLPNNLYKLTTDSVLINVDKKLFTVSNIYYRPTVGPTALAKATGDATAHLKVKVPQVTISGLDYDAHSRTNNFIASQVLISKPSLNGYKDKKHFKDSKNQPLPHDLVQSIKPGFMISSMKVTEGYVRYEELAEKASETGHIYFTNLNCTITNLTNMPKQISRKNPAVIKASALMMGKVKTQATVRLPLLDKSGYHTLKGNIQGGRPQVLNPILVPTSFIKIDKGFVQQINFSATLNRQRATGTMKALYTNLEVEILSTGAASGRDQSLGKKILSKAADWFLIEDSNPDSKGDKARIAQIKVKRDRNKSFISYWKDCLASGLLASMGLEKMAEKQFN
ncbi:AsmA family protein [Pontibacter cellulosilyticus]|uniref:DUF748 domain-containing protein n=1 Tax=Pontibacter cellulosilyticus TaxID=1720253 RepID=A0A923N5D3_9BACT|nr:hypothetical protein [Pontibacter cellulosilyticus]MBC5991786.1 hypothetical protein [Pontibacter cellulosilyticus]